MPIGTKTSVLLATALTIAIANVGQRLLLQLGQPATAVAECGTNPGAACAAMARPALQASRCSLPADRDD